MEEKKMPCCVKGYHKPCYMDIHNLRWAGVQQRTNQYQRQVCCNGREIWDHHWAFTKKYIKILFSVLEKRRLSINCTVTGSRKYSADLP